MTGIYGQIPLPALPRSRDRTRLCQSSPQKREFLRFRPETFGTFSLKLPYSRDRRLNANAKNARKLQRFRAVDARYPRLKEWLAEAAGIEPTIPDYPVDFF